MQDRGETCRSQLTRLTFALFYSLLCSHQSVHFLNSLILQMHQILKRLCLEHFKLMFFLLCFEVDLKYTFILIEIRITLHLRTIII